MIEHLSDHKVSDKLVVDIGYQEGRRQLSAYNFGHKGHKGCTKDTKCKSKVRRAKKIFVFFKALSLIGVQNKKLCELHFE